MRTRRRTPSSAPSNPTRRRCAWSWESTRTTRCGKNSPRLQANSRRGNMSASPWISHPTYERYKMPLILAIVMPIALGIFWLVTTSRAATETPNYKVVRTDAAFEIRDYQALTVATTPMDEGEMNRSFGQLFRFITGSNAEAEKIEMTSPVLIDAAKDKKRMSFIMPEESVEKGVPKPAGDSVSLARSMRRDAR